jgi:hypothetical protein
MKRWVFVVLVLVSLYASVLWQTSDTLRPETSRVEPRTETPERPTPYAVRAHARAAYANAPQPKASGLASEAMPIKHIDILKCPAHRPQEDTACDLPSTYTQKCGYLEGDKEVMCACDAPEDTFERTWICRDEEEEADLAASPTCPADQPLPGSTCTSPTLACPYAAGRLTCACGKDDQRWSCGPRRTRH